MPEDGLTRMSLLIRLPEQEVGNWEGVDVRVGGAEMVIRRRQRGQGDGSEGHHHVA